MISERNGHTAAPSGIPIVQLQLLGQFELKVGREVRTSLLTYDKPRLMLAMLALLGGKSIARARMVELLWPDLSEIQGKTRMRHALHVLRQALAPHSDVLVVHSDRLAINAVDVRVDVSAMLAEGDNAIDDEMCLALYHGGLLDDLRSRIEGPLDEWFEHWRQRLGSRLDQCRSQLVSGWLSKNQFRDALRHARHWIQVWPGEESCYRILIDVLVRTGRYDEARKVYAQCKVALASMLATTPDPLLDALIASLPLSHALPAEGVVEGAPPRYQPLAVLAIALTWRVDSVAVLADSDALEKLDRVCSAIRRCVQAYGGWLAPGGANQFVVYLGYPGASAAPARRAADVAHVLRQWTLPAGLTMQIGLHAALGLCSPNGIRPDNGYLLAQTALALAARARPGEVLVSDEAHCRIDEYDINEIQRDSQLHPALGERRALGVSRMFGRTEEFTELVSSWRDCLAQRISFSMSLIGESGYGKSLLAASLAAQARQVGAKVIWLKCMQDLRDQPLHPLRLWLLDRLLGDLNDIDDDAVAGSLGLSIQHARELAAFLKLGMEATSADVTPEVLQAIRRATAGDASETSPLLVVIDDAQWADSVTQSWITMMLSMAHSSRSMMILTTRLPHHAHVSTHARIDLAALDSPAVASLLSHHTRSLKIGKDVQNEIARLARGNPQLITMMLAQTLSKKDIERPDRMRDHLCAQLFELDAPTRQLAYLCTLYGAPLSPEQAADLLQYDPHSVESSAARLRGAGILVGSPQIFLQCSLVVAHAIVDLIAPSQSVRLSQRIAQYLLEQNQPRIRVAPFLEKSGDSRAPLWWKGAAVDALHIGSLQEASNLITHALRCKDGIPDEVIREKFVFDCQLLRVSITSALSGPAHPEAATSLSMAVDVRRVGDVQTTVVALWSKWTIAQNTGSHIEALRLAQQLMNTAISLQDSAQHGWAAYAIAQHYLWRGMGGEAESLLCQAEALLADVPPVVSTPFGIQASALLPASLGVAYGLQGKYKQAFLTIERAFSTALASNAWVAVLLSQLANARIHYLKGDLDQAAQAGVFVMDRAGAMSELNAWHAIATGYAMLPRVLLSRDVSALETMEAALPVIRAGMPVSVDGHLCLLARARVAMNDLEGALLLLDEAQSLGAAHGSHSLTSEIQCVRGDIWALSGDHNRAQEHWRQARTIAEVVGHMPYVQWANERLLDEPTRHDGSSGFLASHS